MCRKFVLVWSVAGKGVKDDELHTPVRDIQILFWNRRTYFFYKQIDAISYIFLSYDVFNDIIDTIISTI